MFGQRTSVHQQGQTYAEIIRKAEWEEFKAKVLPVIFSQNLDLLLDWRYATIAPQYDV